MTTTALLALCLAASPEDPADAVKVSNQRVHAIDIVYDPNQPRDAIERIELCWSDDRGQTWHAQPAVTPDKKEVVFSAKGDGLYYLSMVMFLKSGAKVPPDITRNPPEIQLLIDATPPKVALPVARRVGDEVQLEWDIADKFPDDARTQVVYRATDAPSSAWTRVKAETFRGRSVKFVPKFTGPVTVRVDVSDRAGNTDGVAKELPGGGEVAAVAVSEPPVRPNAAESAVAPAGNLEPIPPPSMTPPAMSTVVAPPAIVPVVVAAPAVAVTAAVSSAPAFSRQPEPVEPPLTPAAFTPVGAAPAFAPAAPPVPDIKAFNALHFEAAYDVDGGPSGVRHVDLYVTRDDGRTWRHWSRHPAAERPLRVALDQTFGQRNPTPEGDYGFRLVPTSGAGLSEGPPPPGSRPEFRARIDRTPPRLDVYPPQADPAQRHAMVLRWKVTDDNKSREPVLIEWADTPAGPWTAVAGSGPKGTPDAEALTWLLPEGIPAKVYLRFTAIDLAGNRLVTVSNQPFLVDPHRPTAHIQGFSAAPGR